MSGPAIRYDELFDFPSYLEAINQAKKNTVELSTILSRIAETTNSNLAESLGKLKGFKISVGSEKDVEVLKNIQTQINETGSAYTNLKNASQGLTKTNKLVQDSIAAVESETKQLIVDIKTLTEEDRKNESVGGAKIKRLAELKATTNQYNEELKRSIKTLSSAENSYNQLSNELANLKNQIKNLPNAFDATTGALNEQNQEAVRLSKRITEVDGAIKKMDGTMGMFNRNVGNYESGTVSLRQQLKEMREEMGRMALAGEHNTEAYQQLAQKAGELADTMGDVSAEIKRVGSDTSTLEGMVGILEGVAGAAAIAEGSMQLFGEENEIVTESIKKLQAIQTVLLGIQSIANMLQKESAAILLIVNAQKKLNILYTQLQGAAESKNIIIRKVATAAQWLLNAAMSANPAGILIITVTALAAAVLFFTRKTQDAAEAQIRLNEMQAKWIESKEKEIELNQITGRAAVEDAEEELKYAKARGASQLEMIGLEQELLKAKWDTAKANQLIYSVDIKNLDGLISKYSDLRTEIDVLQTATRRGDKEGQKQLEALKGQADNLLSRIKNAQNAQESLFDIEEEINTKRIEKERLIQKIQLENDKLNIDTKLQSAQEESRKEYKLKLEALEAAKNLELFEANDNEVKKANIRAKYRHEELELTKQFEFKQKSNSINAQISILNSKLSLSQKGSNDELSLKLELIEKQYELDKAGVENSVNNENLKAAKLKELYNKQLADKRELEKEKRLAELEFQNDQSTGGEQLEIIKNRQVVANTKSSLKEINQARVNIERLNTESILREFDFNQKKYDEGLISYEEYEKRKTEITIEQENARLAKIEEAAEIESQIQQAKQEFFNEIASGGNELFKGYSDQRIEKIEEEKDRSIKAAGDNANAKARIEEEYNRKAKQEKRKAAIADKIAALFQIALNTAMGITNAASKVVTLPLVPYILAQGLLQAAFVAAKPLPQYRKGTLNAPEGPAIVNDNSGSTFRELIITGNKAYLPSKRNQIVNLRKGDKVIPAFKTAQILANAERNNSLNELIRHQALNDSLALNLESGRKLEIEHSMVNALMASRVNEKAIGDEVGKHISNIPQTIHTMDERGYRKSIRKGNITVNILNDRNSL